MKKIIILAALLIMAVPGRALCLNSTQIDLVNNMSLALNVSNETFISMFEGLCTNISVLQNRTDSLNSSFNITDHAIGNLTYGLSNLSANFSSFNNSLNQTVALAINQSVNATTYLFLNSTMNATMSEFVDAKYAQDKSQMYSSLKANVTDEFDQKLKIATTAMDTFKAQVWNTTMTKEELNTTASDLEARVSTYVAGMERQASTWSFITLMAVVGAIVGFGYFKYRPSFGGVIKGRVKTLASDRMSPQALDTEDEEAVKTKVSNMRTFIMDQSNFSWEARKKVWEKFLNQEISSENEAIEELMLSDPKGAVKNAKPQDNDQVQPRAKGGNKGRSRSSKK